MWETCCSRIVLMVLYPHASMKPRFPTRNVESQCIAGVPGEAERFLLHSNLQASEQIDTHSELW